MKKKFVCLVCIISMLAFSGCGKEKKETAKDCSIMLVNRCFTEDGIVEENVSSRTGKVDYFDYKTKTYRPLCAAPNCLHNNSECFSVYLRNNMEVLGRLGDQWYYQKGLPDGSSVFCRSDLDGQNEKEVGEFSHATAIGAALFYDHFFVASTCDWFIDEETGQVSEEGRCNIYRYDFDTGEEEALVSDREGLLDVYSLFGRYENLLVYLEQDEEDEHEFGLRILDMETGEVTKPLGDRRLWIAASYAMDGKFLVCNVQEEDSWKVVRLNVESGEWEEIPKEGEGAAAEIFWTSELKLLEFWEDAGGENRRKTYQYSEDGTYTLVRETGDELWFSPLSLTDDLIVGLYDGEGIRREDGFELALIRKEDYLAGKNSFTPLQY